jgi:osmotically-inducible protein OsmY
MKPKASRTVATSILALAVLSLSSIGCARGDRDAAQNEIDKAAGEVETQARELGQAATDTAQAVGEQVRSATATAGDEVADALLALKVKGALLDQLGIDGGRLAVDVDGHHVTLAGSVNSQSTSDRAWKVAGAVPGVDSVTMTVKIENDLAGGLIDKQVDRAIDATQGRIADAVLETRVKTRLVEEMGRAAFAVEVEARDGVVSLSGAVPDEIRRALAVQTAERTSGVTRVTDLLRKES